MAHLLVLEDSKRHILLCGQFETAPLTSPCSVVYLLIQIHYNNFNRGGENSLSLNFCALSTAKGMKLIMNELVGDKIKKLRKSLGISQEALAHKICTQSEISRIENKKNNPSYFVLMRIAGRLGVNIQYFLVEDDGAREDYLCEVMSLLNKARRDRDYTQIYEIIKMESKNPLFKKGNNQRYLHWHKGIIEYHLFQDKDKAIQTLLSCLSNFNLNKLFTELDVQILNSLGIIYRNEKDLSNAKFFLEKANNIIKKYPHVNSEYISLKVLYNLSKVYTDLKRFSESLSICFEGVKHCQSSEIFFLFAEFNYQIGRNHLKLDNEIECLNYWKKAKNIFMLQSKEHLANIIDQEIENKLINRK